MATIPAPNTGLHREEWEDTDFDIPEGHALHACDAESDKEGDDDEDWDMEMDLGNTGGAKAKAVVAGIAARSQSFGKGPSPMMITIRPPLLQSADIEEEEDDDEGVSTIKVAALPKPLPQPQPPTIEEDFESAFALPSDMTQLSLAPLGLNHRSSKNSLEWGDKDQTSSSSQSSDTYSNLGLADASPSSNSATSASLPDTESEGEDEEDSELDGLVIPAMFESGQGSKQLKKMLELKKQVQIKEDDVKIASPDPDDDFELGLVIDDEADLSPSRLMLNTQHPRAFARSKSVPAARPPVSTRPLSRLKSERAADRAKSPTYPPPSSTRQFQRLKLSPSPPPKPTRTLSALTPAAPTSFLSPKPGSLRGQKSHSGLKPPTPPSTTRKLTRKASLSSLLETSQTQASGSGSPPSAGTSTSKSRYETPTAASRAKSHTNSTSRMHSLEHLVPPTRPSTPSSNPVALRLTMPSSMRVKSRPALSSVFPSPSPSSIAGPSTSRATSPLPPRPPSSLSLRSRSRQGLNTIQSQPPAPRVLRRPKRQRTYGDGTELDGIDDLPTDREKEGRFRVAPKGYGNRVPGGTYSSKSTGDKGTLRRKGRKDSTGGLFISP